VTVKVFIIQGFKRWYGGGKMRWMVIILLSMLLLVSCATQERVVYHQPLGTSYRPLVYEVVEKEVPKETPLPPQPQQPKVIPVQPKPVINPELVRLQECLERARSFKNTFEDADSDYDDDIDDLKDTEKDMQDLVDRAVLVALQIDQSSDRAAKERLQDDLDDIEDDIDDASDDVKEDQDSLEEQNDGFMDHVDEISLLSSQCLSIASIPSSVDCSMQLSIAVSLEKAADDGQDATDNILDTVKREIRDHEILANAVQQQMVNASLSAQSSLREMDDAYDDTINLLDDIKDDVDDADNDLNDLADDIDKIKRDLSRYCS